MRPTQLAITTIAALLLAQPALAISRYNSTALTCDQVRQRVLNEGAVILRYPSTRVQGMTLYDRYVTRSAMCDPHEYAERAYVPTRDTARCPVLNCQDYDPETRRFGSGKPIIRF
ncbi:MAG: hypothetical protein ABS40_07040 [Agrobacterium sp. SCN 61-19]|nr:MAG: hypothetical protein ABS40_07040 [Agrobacterium sp. SCN 61-19]